MKLSSHGKNDPVKTAPILKEIHPTILIISLIILIISLLPSFQLCYPNKESKAVLQSTQYYYKHSTIFTFLRTGIGTKKCVPIKGSPTYMCQLYYILLMQPIFYIS